MASSQDIFAFRAQFSEFSASTDADIAAVINTADVFLDPAGWNSAGDFAAAKMFFAAHMLFLMAAQAAQGQSSVETEGTGFGDLFVRTIRIGERMVSFGQRTLFQNMTSSSEGGPGDAMLQLTYYGQLYEKLRARSFPAVAIV
jgi:Protein of unknown function (DUF4054)